MTDSLDPDESRVPALRVNQWLKAWDKVEYDPDEHRSKPEPFFYIFSLGAHDLRRLSGIRRRDASDGTARSEDLGIQRRHDPERSTQIAEYVRHGFPWSDLSPRQRNSPKVEDLKKPGWLATSIVINILTSDDERYGMKVAEEDLLRVHQRAGKLYEIELPQNFSKEWSPVNSEPIEIIDGQHRLWAFENQMEQDNYELPVVAFVGLDISWQAYLFWTINIKPKRINASLAFDLYPLLRTENWLDRADGIAVYRETRAQELTEALWASSQSPWKNRINMLGETGKGGVTQAAWIRSLVSTYLRASERRGNSIGGLFGAPVGSDELALPWTRAQQAAFLILLWTSIDDAIRAGKRPWMQSLRKESSKSREESDQESDSRDGDWDEEIGTDPAVAGRHSLLNTDQGVRGFLQVTNDIAMLMADQLELRAWSAGNVDGSLNVQETDAALESLQEQQFITSIRELGSDLAAFDWRTSAAPGLSESERAIRAGFRGTGGYREIRRALLRHLQQSKSFSDVATRILQLLKLGS